LDGESFQNWLEDLLWERRNDEGGADILRAKGLIYTAGSDKRRVLQAVREVYEITDGPVEENSDEVMNKLVFIGRNLDEDALAVGLKSCVARD
jgi:G3E family GTPase